MLKSEEKQLISTNLLSIQSKRSPSPIEDKNTPELHCDRLSQFQTRLHHQPSNLRFFTPFGNFAQFGKFLRSWEKITIQGVFSQSSEHLIKVVFYHLLNNLNISSTFAIILMETKFCWWLEALQYQCCDGWAYLILPQCNTPGSKGKTGRLPHFSEHAMPPLWTHSSSGQVAMQRISYFAHWALQRNVSF